MAEVLNGLNTLYKLEEFSSISDMKTNGTLSVENFHEKEKTLDKNKDEERGAYHPDYPNAKALLVSSKRPRTFLERTAKELLAGGVNTIILSALGDAIPLTVHLQAALEEKKTAFCVKIETTYTSITSGSSRSRYTPGIRIFMKKHPEFKGARISPGYISFCNLYDKKNNTEKFIPCYDSVVTKNRNDVRSDEEKHFFKEGYASVNAGNMELNFEGEDDLNIAFAKVLKNSDITVDAFQALHESMLSRGKEENFNKLEKNIRSVLIDKPFDKHPDIKIALCRLSDNTLRAIDESGKMGSIFISVFKDKFPYNCLTNVAMVYVVQPEGNKFKQKEEFLEAVHATAGNMMTALCDYNGFVRREDGKTYPRISVCRVCLFSAGKYAFENTTKIEVAKALLSGLDEAYRHGPAPRLNFADDEDVFKSAWSEITGMKIFANNVDNGNEFNATENYNDIENIPNNITK